MACFLRLIFWKEVYFVFPHWLIFALVFNLVQQMTEWCFDILTEKQDKNNQEHIFFFAMQITK